MNGIGRQGFVGDKGGSLAQVTTPVPQLPNTLPPILARWVMNNPNNTPASIVDITGNGHDLIVSPNSPITTPDGGVALTSGYYDLAVPIQKSLGGLSNPVNAITLLVWTSDPFTWVNDKLNNANKIQYFSNDGLQVGAITSPVIFANRARNYDVDSVLTTMVKQFQYYTDPIIQPPPLSYLSPALAGNGTKQLFTFLLTDNELGVDSGRLQMGQVDNISGLVYQFSTELNGSTMLLEQADSYGVTRVGSATYSPATQAIGEAMYEEIIFDDKLTDLQIVDYYNATRAYHGV